MRRLILYLLEGPREPRWLTPLVFGISTMAVCGGHSELIVFAAITGWWLWVRYCEYRYYEAFAQEADLSVCPRCQYSLKELDRPVCPECGTDAIAFLARARRMTAESQRRDESHRDRRPPG